MAHDPANEGDNPTHRARIVTYDYLVTGGKPRADKYVDLVAHNTAEALIKVQLAMMKIAEDTMCKWEVNQIIEFAPRNIPGGKAKIVFNADLIEEDVNATPE